MKKKVLPMLLTVLTLAITLTGCSSKPPASGEASPQTEIVKIAYLPITHALPVFELKEMLEKENSNIQVELVKYGSWPELLDALNTSRVDGASVLVELAMKSKEQGIGLKLTALGHRDGNAVVVAKDINTPADLKGKKFAIPHRQSSHNILLNDMLNEAGIDRDELEIVELAPPEMPAALTTGQIAGYCVAEPFGAKGVSLGSGKVLYESGELWEDSICCGFVLTDRFLNDRTDTANAIIDDYNRAGGQLDKDEAKSMAVDYLDQEENVLDLSLQWISYDDLAVTEETYNTLIEKVKKYGLSENPPAFKDFVYPQ